MSLNHRRVYRPTNRATTAQGERTWFKIKNALPTATAEVWIYDEIGDWGITALDFVAELRSVGAQAIDLHINSGGGSVYDGVAIYNAIKNHPAKVTAYIDGLAASAASFIAMAGDEVVMEKTAELMIHDAMGICVGNASDMKLMLEDLERVSDNIAGIYADKAGGDAADWRAVMKEEKWYTAGEAVSAGLADRIQGQEAEPVEAESEEPTDWWDMLDTDSIREALKEAS
jgi:ATP-dependent Clp endopeptidase proteolytic subunit ClpP